MLTAKELWLTLFKKTKNKTNANYPTVTKESKCFN